MTRKPSTPTPKPVRPKYFICADTECRESPQICAIAFHGMTLGAGIASVPKPPDAKINW